MTDILLTHDGDLSIGDSGDVSLTESVRQAVRIRLLWFLGEWRFAPKFGMPYFEEILVKNPNIERLRRAVRDEVLSVTEVDDVRNVAISADPLTRSAKVTLDIVVGEETYREEVAVNA